VLVFRVHLSQLGEWGLRVVLFSTCFSVRMFECMRACLRMHVLRMCYVDMCMDVFTCVCICMCVQLYVRVYGCVVFTPFLAGF
jgi:hypothetical protein